MLSVEIHTLKDGADVLTGRITWDGATLAAEPATLTLMRNIMAAPVRSHPDGRKLTPGGEPEAWLRALAYTYRVAYLRATEAEEGNAKGSFFAARKCMEGVNAGKPGPCPGPRKPSAAKPERTPKFPAGTVNDVAELMAKPLQGKTEVRSSRGHTFKLESGGILVAHGIDPALVDPKPEAQRIAEGDNTLEDAEQRAQGMRHLIRSGQDVYKLPAVQYELKPDGRFQVHDGNARTLAYKLEGRPVPHAVIVDGATGSPLKYIPEHYDGVPPAVDKSPRQPKAPAAAKPAPPTLDAMRERLDAIKGSGATGKAVAALADDLRNMSKADLQALKQEYGLWAGGTKEALSKKIAGQVAKRITARQQFAREARKAGVRPKELFTTAQEWRGLANETAGHIDGMLRQTRQLYRNLTGKPLTRGHAAFKGGDLAQLEKFDEVAAEMAGRYPELLGFAGGSEEGFEASAEASKRLYEYLYAGTPKRTTFEQSCRKALDHLIARGGEREPIPETEAEEPLPF